MTDTNSPFQNSATLDNLIGQIPGTHVFYEIKYREALKTIPVPGYGHGCNTSLPKYAAMGIRAGHTKDEIFVDLRVAIPVGRRVVSDQEIDRAIDFAFRTNAHTGNGSPKRYSMKYGRRKKLSDAEAAEVKKHILSYSRGPVYLDCEEFRNAHGFHFEPQPIMDIHPEAFTMIQLIRELYEEDDLLLIGSEGSVGPSSIRSAAEWLNFFEVQQRLFLERLGNDGWNSPAPSAFLTDLGRRYSHIVPNPVTGRWGKKKEGGLSLRCDGSIRAFKYAILDFDDFGLEKQGEILHCLSEALEIRFCALVHTGGRGFHGWMKVEGVDSPDAWDKIVRDGLFPTFEALGADPACANCSRGSRLAGVFRPDTASWQKLIITTKKGFAL